MKNHRIMIGIIAALSSGMAASALADTQYHFSGNACQPLDSANAAKIQTIGAGSTNKDTAVGSTAKVTCPVTGVIATSINQSGTFKVHVHNLVSGFWELDDATFTTFWWSSNKTSSPTGNTDLTWTGSELYGGIASNYTAYSFRATIFGRCTAVDVPCATDQSYLQAYWVTHVQS